MKTQTVKLNDGQEFTIKNSNRTYILFEEYRGKCEIDITSHTDLMWWSYCILKGSNKDVFKYTFDEFIDLSDENPQIFTTITDFNASVEVIETPVEPDVKVKKKQGNR